MKRRAGAALLAGLTFALAPAFVGAVDRSAGAHVPKPVLGGQPWNATAKARLARDIETLLDGAPTLRGAHVGLLVLDTRSGEIVYSRNADDAFVPASTFKLLTGSVALATLGPQFRFRTEAFVDAARRELIVHGGGDPLLRLADLQAMAAAVRASGVAALAQGVGVDAGAFADSPYPPGWSWDDFPNDYAPVLSAATIEENVVHLTIGPGAAVGAPVRVTVAPALDGLDPAPATCSLTHGVVVRPNATTTEAGTAATLDIARAPSGCIDVVGSLPRDAPPQQIDAAVPSPIWYLRQLARTALRTAGVDPGRGEVTGIDPDGGAVVPLGATTVWTHDGEPLADLLADMWWPSDNLVAENLLKAIGIARTGIPGTIAHAADTERAWLTGIGVDPGTVTIADGSGLSTYDRITPRALAAILQADWNGPYRDIVLDDLPLAGVRGTLQESFTGTLAERRTFAKTGSVSHARGLAGYLATLHHGAITFAWSVDDWMGESDDLATLRARVLSRIIGD